MPASFILTLDTTAPQGVAVEINGGDPSANDRDVLVAVTTTDPDTTGYMVKVWGDVQDAPDEASAPWQMLTAELDVQLTLGDGVKTVNARLRDDVWNVSASASDTITLDTTSPVVTISAGPDVTKVSRVLGHRQATFQFTASEDFDRFEVRFVPSAASEHTAGTLLTNTSGGSTPGAEDGLVTAGTPTTIIVDGRDVPDPDGDHRVKVFVRDVNGNWSVDPS